MVLSTNILNQILIILAGILAIFLVYLICLVILVVVIDKIFLNKRLGEHLVKPIEYTYYKDLLKEDFSFYSKKNKLIGAIFYKNQKTDKIMIVVHGYGANYKNYLPEINFFTNLGYTVYTYDGTATSLSEGKRFGGAPQAIKDLEQAIIKVKELNPDKKITLFGHSMGGYAVCNILNYQSVDKVIAVAPFDNMPDIIRDDVYKKFGRHFFLLRPVYKFIQWLKFGKYSKPTTYKTLSTTKTKVLVVHGENDQTVFIDHFLYNLEHNENPNVNYLYVKDKMHRPLQSARAVAYHEYLKLEEDRIKLKYKKALTDDIRLEFNSKIDQEIKNELDEEVLSKIEEFLEEK